MQTSSPKKTIPISLNKDKPNGARYFYCAARGGKSTFYKKQFIDTHIRLNDDMLKTAYREKTAF